MYLESSCSERDLVNLLNSLNNDKNVNGVLVQVYISFYISMLLLLFKLCLQLRSSFICFFASSYRSPNIFVKEQYAILLLPTRMLMGSTS